MKKALIILGVSVLAAFAVWFFVVDRGVEEEFRSEVNDFESCAASEGVVMESYPRQCRDDEGNVYVEEIDEEANAEEPEFTSEKGIEIRLEDFERNQEVTSPLQLEGEVPGNWSFEGDFPVLIRDANGAVLGQGPATLQGDWMTEDYVQFTLELEFTEPETDTGELVLERDNPSDLEENADQLVIPITFIR